MSAQVDTDKANESCVGPSSEEAGKAEACAGCPNAAACASGAGRVEDPTPALVQDALRGVKHVILVLSGKGGVGKSTVSCQLAMALASKGQAVGLLDIDICGPSVPRMLGLRGRGVHRSSAGWSPVFVDAPNDGELGVMSVGFMLPDDDNAVVWRGPRKNGLIKQFLTEVDWGDLDALVIDTPPGTSDEHISIAQYLKLADLSGAVVVTTPQEVSMQDVRKELNFCAKAKIPVLGIVENMARLVAPMSSMTFADRATGEDRTEAVLAALRAADPTLLGLDASVDVFSCADAASSPRSMAAAFGTRHLGALPLDPELQRACDAGRSLVDEFPKAAACAPFQAVVDALLAALPDRDGAAAG